MFSRAEKNLITLIVSAVFVFALAVALSPAILGGAKNQGHVTRLATQYARELYPNQEVRVTCAGHDTDGDGYASCSIVVGSSPPQAVECANWYSINSSGCRIARVLPVDR